MDLFHAHIGGHGRLRPRAEDRRTRSAPTAAGAGFVKERYRAGTASSAAGIESATASFTDLEAYILPKGEPPNTSGRQEMLENLINEFI